LVLETGVTKDKTVNLIADLIHDDQIRLATGNNWDQAPQ
jgi:hypothetical protein